MLKIVVMGRPIAKKRPKFVSTGKYPRAYNDQKTEEGRWLLEVMHQLPGQPLEGAVKVLCSFVFPRPKAHFGTGRNSGKLKPSAPFFHTQKPDVDNCLKFVKDCLNGKAYHDDSQVVLVWADKRWAQPGESAKTEMFLGSMEGEDV